jgi:hypothetical protein
VADKDSKKLEIIILGRDKIKAADLQAQLKTNYPDVTYETFAVDYKDEEKFKSFLKEQHIDTLIHTSGPFDNQTQRQYLVARSCVQNGTNYIDLADDREFVSGIYSLDEQAKKSNVAVISGASTVPGISYAVVEHLSKHFSVMESVECSLNVGSATIPKGKATIESLLLYCGKPYKVLKNGEWRSTYGYLNMKLQTFLGLHTSRIVSDFNVPDLTLLPQKYPSLKTVDFKAGVELKLQQLGMTWMGWLTKNRIFSAWSKLGSIAFEPVRRFFAIFGGEEGVMKVTIKGQDKSGVNQTADWYLIAVGDGPNNPVLPAIILANKLAHNKNEVVPGAYPCLGTVKYEELDQMWRTMNYATYTHLIKDGESLGYFDYGLGELGKQLPEHIYKYHTTGGLAKGNFKVTRGKFLGNLCATLGGLPKANESAEVIVDTRDNVWHRTFDGKPLISKWDTKSGLVLERFGIFSFGFQFAPVFDKKHNIIGFKHVFKKMWLFNMIPLPRFLAIDPSGSTICVDGSKDSWHVEVNITNPIIGKLAKYEGIISVLKLNE